MAYRIGVLVMAAACVAAGAPFDLDVDLDRGRPYDFIKTPKDTPTGGGREDASTTAGSSKPASGAKPGETVAEDLEKKKKEEPPPKPPSGLPGTQAPSTIDWATHINWTPKDDIVEWKDPMPPTGAPTPTGKTPEPPKGPEPKGPEPKGGEPWDMRAYPPKVPNDMYVYCATRFLQVLLHRPQVSESELTQFLIDMDYPAYYAATAVKNDGDLKGMTVPILQGVGPMVKTPPAKPEGELRQRVYMDLLLKYPYEKDFGSFIVSQPSGQTMPVLLQIIENERHPFLVRNAVFILRCFNNIEIVEPLFKLLSTTKDMVIRNRALIALARWGHAGVAKWCGQRLKGGDSFRTLAVWAIGRTALASPIDTETVDRVMTATGELDSQGEFLLSAVPALGQIGRSADAATKKKIESLLRRLQQVVAGIKNPGSQGGSTGLQSNPDPAGVRAKIIDERIRVAIALMGDASEIKWMEGARGTIHITNTVLFDEAQDLIKGKK